MFLKDNHSPANAGLLTRRELLCIGAATLLKRPRPQERQVPLPTNNPVPAKRMILLWMAGGLPHLDTFDPKPAAPLAIRGLFGTIPTNANGMQISDRLPRLARHADKFTILRGISHGEGGHERAAAYVRTGFLPDSTRTYPDFGDVLTRHIGQHAPPVANQNAAQYRNTPDYGNTQFGRGCLTARRLVQSGIPFVTVTLPGFDTHSDHFAQMKNTLLPTLDFAFSALLEDLHQRGLLDSTLVICMGEFGRSPRINSNSKPGRDHWPSAMCAVMAGGGIRGGTVFGATDSHGMAPAAFTIRPEDVLATIYHLAGVPQRSAASVPGNILHEICG